MTTYYYYGYLLWLLTLGTYCDYLLWLLTMATYYGHLLWALTTDSCLLIAHCSLRTALLGRSSGSLPIRVRWSRLGSNTPAGASLLLASSPPTQAPPSTAFHSLPQPSTAFLSLPQLSSAFPSFHQPSSGSCSGSTTPQDQFKPKPRP
jgi:hypothetical protein